MATKVFGCQVSHLFPNQFFCLCLLVGLGYMGDSKETRELQQWCPATPEVLRQPSPPLQVPEFS